MKRILLLLCLLTALGTCLVGSISPAEAASDVSFKVTNVVANLLLIPRYGIEGAASATLLANCLLTGGVIVLFYYQRLLKEHHA